MGANTTCGCSWASNTFKHLICTMLVCEFLAMLLILGCISECGIVGGVPHTQHIYLIICGILFRGHCYTKKHAAMWRVDLF
jgi:hypothetical protein